MPSTRRRFLTVTAAATTSVTLAGCATSGLRDRSTPTPASYDRLRQAPTHVDDEVDLTLPDAVPTAGTPAGALLVVLPGTTDVPAGTAIDWLVAGRGVALVGTDAEATFTDWRTSDAHHEAFEPPHGASSSDPKPELLVAFAVGREFLTTYRYTWGHTDDPADREVLGALEEALAGEAEDGRPRRGTATPRTATERG